MIIYQGFITGSWVIIDKSDVMSVQVWVDCFKGVFRTSRTLQYVIIATKHQDGMLFTDALILACVFIYMKKKF